MKSFEEVCQKSCKILNGNMSWLLSSDIRIKKGPNKGALYGWKNLKPVSFPFIYSEITGYAITCFSWIASEFGNPNALRAAKDSAGWIVKNMRSHLLVARLPAVVKDPNDLSDVYYSFDNGMILIGLLNLYKITKNTSLLVLAEKMTQALIERFFDGEKLNPRIDNSYNPITKENCDGIVKWSTISGAYHCKLSIGLLELSKLTGNPAYAQMSNSLCDYAKKLQRSNGQFITNTGSDIAFLHPHLYACEGLIYSGLTQSNDSHCMAGLNGIRWAMDQIDADNAGGLIRNTGKESIEQSDCTAQLLRLLLLCRSKLAKSLNVSDLDIVIDRLHSRLLAFHIPTGDAQGAMRYQLALDSACSWCTMFSVQALRLWSMKKSDVSWIDYFV